MKTSLIQGLKSLFVTALMLAAFSNVAVAQKADADFTKAEKQEINQILGSDYLIKFEGNRNLRIAPRGKAELLNVTASSFSNPDAAPNVFLFFAKGMNIVYKSGALITSELSADRIDRLNKVLGYDLRTLGKK